MLIMKMKIKKKMKKIQMKKKMKVQKIQKKFNIKMNGNIVMPHLMKIIIMKIMKRMEKKIWKK